MKYNNLHPLHEQEHMKSCEKQVFCSLSKLLNKTTPQFQYFLLLFMVALLFQNKAQSTLSVSANSAAHGISALLVLFVCSNMHDKVSLYT